jgi:hypothetical protein
MNNTEIGLDVMHCFSLCRYLLRQLHNIFCFNTLKLYFQHTSIAQHVIFN